MKNKVLYEVQGEVPVQYCVDGKESAEKLEKCLKAVDAALEYLSNHN